MTHIADELRKVREALEYEQVDAWVERSDGTFEYRGLPGYGLDEAFSLLDRLIPEIELMEQDVENSRALLEAGIAVLDKSLMENAPQSHRNAPRSDEEAYNAEMVEKIIQASAESPTVFFNSVEEFNEWMDNNAQEGK